MAIDTLIGALLIFLTRLTDVSIGTLRISMLVRGYRKIAGALGFVEALLWLFATSKAIQSIDDPVQVLAFGAGFAAGNIFGSTIDSWLALGSCVVRVIAPLHSPQVADTLRQMGFEITVLNATGATGEARLTFGIIAKRRQKEVLRVISKINPEALVSIDAVTTADLRSHAVPRQNSFNFFRLLQS